MTRTASPNGWWALLFPLPKTAVLLLVVTACALLFGCSDDDKPNAPGPVATAIADSLVFTRSDSTVIEMGTMPLVCCGLYDPSFVNQNAIRVVLYDPGNQKAGWQILILTDLATPDSTYLLPTNTVGSSKVPLVSMFLPDITRGNELNSDTQDSFGTITVHSFVCGTRAIEIDFSIDATLGSEFAGGSTVSVKGRFRATFPTMSCS